MNLMVGRLCLSAAFVPVAVTMHSEQILCDLSRYDPPRFIRIALPYATLPSDAGMVSHQLSTRDQSINVKSDILECQGESPQVRLLALHVIAVAIKHIESAQLLVELPFIINAIIPSLTSALVDLRKAVIFVLVNSYLIIGDALYPFVSELPTSAKKLLTIYIDKEMTKNKEHRVNAK